jgi:hypothetical protein
LVGSGEEEDMVLGFGRRSPGAARAGGWWGNSGIEEIGIGIGEGLAPFFGDGTRRGDLGPDEVLPVRGGDEFTTTTTSGVNHHVDVRLTVGGLLFNCFVLVSMALGCSFPKF